ncbi:MAG: phosphoglucomutase (alpha-D-glucose-1,6-bisphosphate-dependent) [Acidobacteriota bacterium]|nr:phosphoglucomutase (alpha-D-glucose-1,6-bisphosphate-dependent) [Acidobacteriota bacterium]MDQ7087782.1 phosphoglucomutase (alpha-D-glucose-1,6-bisphosphate-dependent) [Acidobacteriota bacterium]
MKLHPLAGKPVPPENVSDIPRLVSTYYVAHPDPAEDTQKVSFGTSGHRGSSLRRSFNEDHILAICRAICLHRQSQGIEGPLFIGKDTHALSDPALITAVEVFAAHGVEVVIQAGGGATPTPVISRAILVHNRDPRAARADGVVITPSHNPPEDGGFKYNPPHGGPAEGRITGWIQDQANATLEEGVAEIPRLCWDKALGSPHVHERDFIEPFVADLHKVLDMEAIAASGVRIGVDPMGGAGREFWPRIAERYGLSLEVVNPRVDPAFAFMRIDHDGKIRMDCSSPYAMASLVDLRDRFDIAFGNDADADRHGIVTPGTGLMNPNHYLSVAVDYLFRHRERWPRSAAVGKTLVSSSLIDRVAADLGRRLAEVPVGFKWFVSGLLSGEYGFGGEESAGASFLCRDGSVWTTDKDGLAAGLLAAEIIAVTGADPGEHYKRLTSRFGEPVYERTDAPATPAQKRRLAALRAQDVAAESLAGEKIIARLTHSPEGKTPIGGLKVVTENGWFAARPSGTEDIYKIYAESFRGRDHLEWIQREAQEIVGRVIDIES